jgi:hypothetical protein
MRNTIPSINIPINNKRSITTSTSMDRILGTNPTLACIPTSSSSSNRSLIRRCPLMLLTHRTSRSINMASTRIIIRRRSSSSSISTNLLQLLISKSINTHHSKLHRHRLRLRLKSKRRIRWCNNWD